MRRQNLVSRTLIGGLLLALVPLFIFWHPAPAPASSHSSQQGRSQKKQTVQVVPGVVVIKMRAGSSPSSGNLQKSANRAAQILKTAGVLSLQKAFPAAHPLPLDKASGGKVDVSLIYFGTISTAQDPVAVAKRLDESGQFEYAEPKYMNHTFGTPNDQYYAQKQALYFNQMNVPAGWGITTGSSSVVIADVDGGTAWQHPDLRANLWINPGEDINHNGIFEPTSASLGGDDNGVDDDNNGFVDDVIGWNFANNSNDPTGLSATPNNYAHGTATASHFGSVTNNTIGMAGTSWNCRLMPIDVGAPQSDEEIQYGYEGIQYAYSNGANVINCSWGRSGISSKFEQDLIDAATQAGALIVAAAGNDGVLNDYLPQFPANYRNVLSVGATQSGLDVVASFSNYGLTVPVYAPGTDIWSAFTNGTYGDGGSGTSYASPLTAGLAGLVKSLHPAWTPRQIATQIRMSSDSIGTWLGHGRVNFGRALTETHAGLEVLSSSLLTPQGGKLFLPGDTVVLNMTVRNIMFVAATNLSFSPSTTDPVLLPLQGSTGSVTLAAGDSLVLPPLLFKVGPMTASIAVVVRIDWTDVAGVTNERDAFAFGLDVFPTTPLWEDIQSPTFTSLWSICAVDKNTLWAAGGNGSATSPVVLRSLDGGITWGDATGNLSGVDLYCVNAIDTSRAWAGTGDGKIFATVDAGTTWTAQSYPAPQSPFIDGIKIFPDLSGFALGDPATGGKFVVLSTTDGGLHWSHLANEPVGTSTEAGWNNSFCWTDKLHGWFGSNTSTIWKTNNGGATWTGATAPDAQSVSLSFQDSLHGVAGYSDGGVTTTTDGGVTWSLVTSPTSLSVATVSYVPGTSYIWASDAGTPYLSTDRGSTWTAQTTFPFAGSVLHGTFVDTTDGWMVSSFGEVLLYHGNLATSVGSTGSSGLPTKYSLEQNYPNPFNPTTTIRFLIPSRSRVRLTIYNILGQQVTELVNKEFAAGTYEQSWGGNVSSGIYFYRIEATSLDNSGKKFVDVKKMVMIK